MSYDPPRVALKRCLLRVAAVVGVLLVGACGSLPAVRERPVSNAAPVDPATPLARIVAASTPPGEHSGFRLMPLGLYSLDARIQLAQRARHSLVVQYYQLEADGAGRWLMQALRAAAARGVKVRVLVDDIYTENSQQPLLALSQVPNVEVRLYNPFCCGRDGFVSRFAASPHEVVRLNHRMHNKLFVADGAMAVIGGRNIADEYFVLSEAQNFIDMDALVVGQVVRQLEAVFDGFWNSPEVWPIGEIVATGQDHHDERNEMLNAPTPLSRMALPPSDILGYGPIAEELDDGRLGLLWGEARTLADPPSKPRTMSAAEALSTSVTMHVWRLVRDADSDVSLTSPYLVPGERGMEILDGLGRRQVGLTLLTNSLAANDVPLVHTAYVRYRKRLLQSPVDLYELSPARTTSNERFGAFGHSLGRLHAKTLTIDRRHVFIGSMNLDPRSATQNTEMGVMVDSPELAREMLRVITVSKLQNSYRLRLAEGTGDVEWLSSDGEKEVVLTAEPETGFWERAWIRIVAPFVPESLL